MAMTTMTMMKRSWGTEEQKEEEDSMPVETDDEAPADE